MLIENAFHYLPEILCGSNYAAQEYEAGIVNAVSLAVLQELNARNVPNPLAALTVERLYSTNGFMRPDDQTKRRYLRADLFVDTSRTFAGTEALSRFGWRHKNYIEAKFFRPGGAASTNNAALLLGDVIRLCALTPPIVAGSEKKHLKKRSPCDGTPSSDGKYDSICVGRYLLHVYEGDPLVLMGKHSRSWLKDLRKPGSGTISLTIGNDKSDTFRKAISKELDCLALKVRFTNSVISQNPAKNRSQYLCVLTRIDSFNVSLDGLTWTESDDRTGEESKPGSWRELQRRIGTHIMFKAKGRAASEEKAEETPPSDNEMESGDLGDLIAVTDLTAESSFEAEQELRAETELKPQTEFKPKSE